MCYICSRNYSITCTLLVLPVFDEIKAREHKKYVQDHILVISESWLITEHVILAAMLLTTMVYCLCVA